MRKLVHFSFTNVGINLHTAATVMESPGICSNRGIKLLNWNDDGLLLLVQSRLLLDDRIFLPAKWTLWNNISFYLYRLKRGEALIDLP